MIERGKLKGEITIFLTLLFGVIFLFVNALISSSTVVASKNYVREEANLAVESVFAEYHTTLFQEYHIFAVELTYESGDYDLENLENRLELYGADELEWEITQLQLLSDCTGAAYKEQILTYMKQKYGIDYLENIIDIDGSDWENQRISGGEVLEEGDSITDELTSLLDGLDEEVEDATNLLDFLSFVNSGSVLDFVLADGMTCSTVVIDEGSLASNKNVNTGINTYQLVDSGSMLDDFLIIEYMIEHFTSAVDSEDDSESSTLLYEIEYFLAGNLSDEENLEEVVNQLILLRTAVNYTCLLSSASKIAAVKAWATSIATASGMPLLEPVVEQALLISWSYGESILEVRGLLSGGNVPVIKTEADWSLDISGLFALGKEDDIQVSEGGTGLSYEDYLRILLYLESEDQVIERSLDMIEENICKENDCEYFQVDQCMTQLEYTQTSTIAGMYTYEFPVLFTYR